MGEKGITQGTTIGRYCLSRGSSLGVDSFGTAVSAIDRVSKERVTIKLLPKTTDRAGEHGQREFENHALHHPHILRCKETFVDNHRLCVVLEYCGGGTLWSYAKSNQCIHEPLARWYFQQLILAVDFVHRMNLVHGDIKLENILLDETCHMAKLWNFRFAEDSIKGCQQNCLGTMEYIAPEILSHVGAYSGRSVDIWACGVCLYQMIYGLVPDPVEIRAAAAFPSFRKIVSKAAQIPTHQFTCHRQPIKVSEGCRDFMMRLLEKDPDRRATMEEIMGNEWFRSDLPDGALEYNDELIAAMQRSAQI